MTTRTPIEAPEKWTEARIGRAIVRSMFNSSVLAVPCCGWTGHEADLLIIEKGLRLIDIEVKISRSDLKADLGKDKWWVSRPWSRSKLDAGRDRRPWPPRVWKHYYALPEAIWAPELEAALPEVSGILLLRRHGAVDIITPMRRAKPNRDATRLQPHECIDLARLAGLRMWDALQRVEQGKVQPKGR